MGPGRLASIGWSLAAVALLVVALPSVSGRAEECPPGDGVTVVVDFADLGEGVIATCVSSSGSGFEALAEAGFAVTRVQSSPAFVCRINGLPDENEEDCADVPPGSSYWAYWVADRGQSWRYSSTGASGSANTDFEGWVFTTDTDAPPGYTVPAVPAPITTATTVAVTTTSVSTTTTTMATTTTTTVSTDPTSTSPPPTSTPTTSPSTTPASTTTVAPVTTAGTPPPTTVATDPPGDTTAPVVAEVTAPPTSDSSPVATVVVAVIAAIGAAAFFLSRRRP